MAYGVFLWAFFALILILASVVIRGRSNGKRAVGFFHPYTNDGGGGERVLWCAVKAIQELSPDLDCVIYTGDHDASPDNLLARAIDRFGVKLLYPPKVVHLYKRKWIEESTFPHFTMIGQSLGSVYLSWEALCKFTPLYYFDTSGYAFTYPLARIFGCKVICYTHYPTISLDMVSRVRDRSAMYNNDTLIAHSTWLSLCKVIYYTFFSWMYGIVGSYAHLAMVNSSWTQSHIEKLWKIPKRTKRVYPPCDTSGLQINHIADCAIWGEASGKFAGACPNKPFPQWHLGASHNGKVISSIHEKAMERVLRTFVHRPMSSYKLQFKQVLSLERSVEVPKIISVAQFRPEKAHGVQLDAFSVAIRKLDGDLPRPKLQFVGSCRNKSDEERLQNLKDKAIELKVEGDVEFHKNVMYSDLVELLGGAVAGIHSMVDEHFGISVVEYMAAGAIPIAHNSAGPKMDIVLDEDGQKTGFLAQSVEEYTDAILEIIRMPESERLKMAAAARKRAGRFSEQRFYVGFKAAVSPILCHASR